MRSPGGEHISIPQMRKLRLSSWHPPCPPALHCPPLSSCLYPTQMPRVLQSMAAAAVCLASSPPQHHEPVPPAGDLTPFTFVFLVPGEVYWAWDGPRKAKVWDGVTFPFISWCLQTLAWTSPSGLKALLCLPALDALTTSSHPTLPLLSGDHNDSRPPGSPCMRTLSGHTPPPPPQRLPASRH